VGRRVRLTHLLDSSVLKRLQRAEVAAAVDALGQGVARPSIVDLEICYSARNAAEWDRLAAALGAVGRIPTTAAHVERALQVQSLLAERSSGAGRSPVSSWPRRQRPPG
jgi:predicted nucleic acid-binding protein